MKINITEVMGVRYSVVYVDQKTYVKCTRCQRYLADVFVRDDGVYGSTCIDKVGGNPKEVYTMLHANSSPLQTQDGRPVKASTILSAGE